MIARVVNDKDSQGSNTLGSSLQKLEDLLFVYFPKSQTVSTLPSSIKAAIDLKLQEDGSIPHGVEEV